MLSAIGSALTSHSSIIMAAIAIVTTALGYNAHCANEAITPVAAVWTGYLGTVLNAAIKEWQRPKELK